LLTTLIDCGVSLIARSRLVAPLLTRLARWATTSTASRSVAVSPPASCGADSATPGSQARARASAAARRPVTSEEPRTAAVRARSGNGERMGMGKRQWGKARRRREHQDCHCKGTGGAPVSRWAHRDMRRCAYRSEEHTSELQSRENLGC